MQGNLLTRVNSGGASFHAPPPLAARGLTRRRWKLKKQGLWNVLFPLCPPKPPATCRTRKETHTSRF